MSKLRRLPAWLALPLAAAGCALQAPAPSVPVPAPTAWHAPADFPHHSSQQQLVDWWKQAGDPALPGLIEAAQAASPTLEAARSRFRQAQAVRSAASAALGPTLDATAQASRGFSQIIGAVATQTQGGVQASWEIDLFGANRATRDAAQARLEGAQAQWHAARTSVAAEVANELNNLRGCRRDLAILESDAASRAETARLTGLAAQAGFQSPADAALARAAGAESAARATQQRALCEVSIKALVALTALDEPALRARLDAAPGATPPDALFSIASVPAAVLAQRPDVFEADRNVAAASAEVGSAQAQRYPRLSLAGNIGTANVRTQGTSFDLNTWTIGPLALTLPLFDGGRRAADIEAARARYDEAVTQYRATARQAVREVEEALVQLDGIAARTADARAAVEGYRASFEATEQSHRNGLASLLDLENSRRMWLAARTAESSLERERTAAWIALYRAMGGGWQQGDPVTPPATDTP